MTILVMFYLNTALNSRTLCIHADRRECYLNDLLDFWNNNFITWQLFKD